MQKTMFVFALAMTAVVVGSNVLVNYPVSYSLGPLNLADLLTYGAFTYPVAFLITDLTNRRFGPAMARRIVFVGFSLAVVCSIIVPQVLYDLGLFPFELSASRLTRIAIASGSAFLLAQLLDVIIFSKLRHSLWWKPPLVSSVVGSVLDTALFFTLAFSSSFLFLGQGDEFASELAPFMAIFSSDVPRWLSWAIGDLLVKLLVALVLLFPYGLLVRFRSDKAIQSV